MKFPRYSLIGEPQKFYLFIDQGPGKPTYWSGWICGSLNLFYKLQRMDKKEYQEACDKLADKFHWTGL